MRLRRAFCETHQPDLVAAFGRHQQTGRLEIITCAATHAFLPLMQDQPGAIRAQILTARDHYRECFGCSPRGIWLPECAYVPGIETYLQEAEIRWFVLDTHGLLFADPRPFYNIYAPVYTPAGVAAFARDIDSSRQVWSSEEGYPGDFDYRDFYRDVGFDQRRIGLHHLCFRARSREDIDVLHAYLRQEGVRVVHAPEEGPWAPGYYSVLFEDPIGTRLEVNHVPGKGVLAEGVSFNPGADYR